MLGAVSALALFGAGRPSEVSFSWFATGSDRPTIPELSVYARITPGSEPVELRQAPDASELAKLAVNVFARPFTFMKKRE